MGLEIVGGGGRHESAKLMSKVQETLEGFQEHAAQDILKNRVFLMPFPSAFLCMEQVANEKKILGILMDKTGRLPDS